MSPSTPIGSRDRLLYPGIRPVPRGFPPPPESPAAIREWDRRAMEDYGIPGIALMECAGRSAAALIQALHEEDPTACPAPFRVLCGPGNNGGDGFVVVRQLHAAGLAASAFSVEGTTHRPGSDSLVNLRVLERLGLAPTMLPAAEVERALEPVLASGTIVDALFGTGLARPLASPFREVVEVVLRSRRPVVSIDIPSGLDGTTGEVLGVAIRADRTITFAASKTGFGRGRGPEHCGTVHVVDIGLPRALWASEP